MRELMAAEGETLHEHMDEALRKYNELFLSKGYGRFVANKFKGFLTSGDCGTLAGLAILLHDIGKSHFEYQANLEKPGIPHEVYSAALAWNALSVSENEKDVVAAAILLHHEYMRLPNPSSVTKGFEGYVEEVRGVVHEVSLKHGLRSYVNTSKIDALRSEKVRTIIEHLNKKLRDRQFYVYAMLILHPLVICDNFSAYLHRRGAPPRLLKDVEDPRITSYIQDYLRGCLKLYG